jgi:uncharacterized protein YecT (DUF1311 family)
MSPIKTWLVGVVLVGLSAEPSGADAKDKSGEFVLVTAPTGDFRLVRKSDGAIWVVPAKSESEHVVLPAAQIDVRATEERDSVQHEPRCFISPDERWIFVQIDIDDDNTNGILYQRTKNPSDGGKLPQYQAAIAEAFDHAATKFASKDLSLDTGANGIAPGGWQSLYFCAWSADSARLLLGLTGTASKPKETAEDGSAQNESSVSILCYFNTQTDAFEVTDRLRKANSASAKSRPDRNDPNAAEAGAVLSAESVGQESQEPSVADRFKQADTALNDVYKKLLTSLSPAAKTQFQDEERAWLIERDTSAAVHSLQSWSPFPNASRIEGLAIATEKRVAELRKRLPSETKS